MVNSEKERKKSADVPEIPVKLNEFKARRSKSSKQIMNKEFA